MNKRLGVPTLLLSLMLAACTQDAAQSTATAATTDQPAPTAEQAAPAPEAPAGDTAAAPDTAAEAPADAEAATAAPAPAPRAPQGPAPVPGTDYVEIANGQPFQPLNGQIEVAEVFGYTCPACAQFEPLLVAWKQRQPADVRLTHIAAPFGGYWMPYAKAYYAAETLGLVERTHQAMFEAIHLRRTLPVQNASNDAIAAFYAQHGADPKRFASTMDSFAVNGKLKRAEQFISRAGVDSTPSMVVNGKYRVTGGRSYEDVLRIVDHLVAQERAAQQ